MIGTSQLAPGTLRLALWLAAVSGGHSVRDGDEAARRGASRSVSGGRMIGCVQGQHELVEWSMIGSAGVNQPPLLTPTHAHTGVGPLTGG